MDKDLLQVHDTRLNKEYARQCTLWVEMGADGLSYLVLNKVREVVAMKFWHFNVTDLEQADNEMQLRQILASELPLSFEYENVHCSLFSPRATLVPLRLFNPDQLDKYFQLLLHPGEHNYAYDVLQSLDCALIYVKDPALTRLADYYFPESTVSHQASPLLQHWNELAAGEEHGVFVHFRSKYLQVAVFDQDKLQFYNTFVMNTASDALYFTMLGFDQFRLNPLSTPLVISGSVLKDAEIFKLVSRFVTHIRFAERPGKVVMEPGIPKHIGFDLFSAAALQAAPEKQL